MPGSMPGLQHRPGWWRASRRGTPHVKWGRAERSFCSACPPPPRPRPLRGRRGVRAAPPLDPPRARCVPMLSALTGTGARAPDTINGPPLRSRLRVEPPRLMATATLAVPCSGCGAVAPHLDRGEACRRARSSLEGRRYLQCLLHCECLSHPESALARRAGPAASAWSLRPPRWLRTAFAGSPRSVPQPIDGFAFSTEQ